MLLSELNMIDVMMHGASIVGVFVQYPPFLILTVLVVFLTAWSIRYNVQQKAAKLKHAHDKDQTQPRWDLYAYQQHNLQMAQNENDKI